MHNFVHNCRNLRRCTTLATPLLCGLLDETAQDHIFFEYEKNDIKHPEKFSTHDLFNDANIPKLKAIARTIQRITTKLDNLNPTAVSKDTSNKNPKTRRCQKGAKPTEPKRKSKEKGKEGKI